MISVTSLISYRNCFYRCAATVTYKTNPKLIETEKKRALSGLEEGVVPPAPQWVMKTVGIDIPMITESTKGLDQKFVQKLVRRITEGEAIPPILVDAKMNVHDGHHRLAAAKIAGVKRVPILVWMNPVFYGFYHMGLKKILRTNSDIGKALYGT